jgi:hypothetical protein
MTPKRRDRAVVLPATLCIGAYKQAKITERNDQ